MIPRVLEQEVMDTLEAAQAYDAMDNDAPNTAFTERLLALRARGRMLDIGTGPGHIPLLVAERLADCTIVAIDLSPNMLTLAERRRAASPAGGRVTFELANAKALPYPDGSFDGVFSNTILHHLPDPGPFLREAGRVLRPGGVLLIRDLFRPESTARIDELVALHAADGTPEQQALLRDSLHAALTPDEMRALAQEAGLADCELVVDTDRHMSLQRRAI